MSTQYINDEGGTPIFAIVPMARYMELLKANKADDATEASSASLFNADEWVVKLPHAGVFGFLDVRALITWMRNTFPDHTVAINNRAQSLSAFPDEQYETLDPWIRRNLSEPAQKYLNTMQATNAVVDALVETGIFKRVKMSVSWSPRKINGLRLDVDKLEKVSWKHLHKPS
jgi:hypothetical protein